MLPDPDILCLDEATSSIDPATEQEIQRLMREISRGRTLITIAHRLATVKEADRLLVLEAGKLVGEGGHEELLRTCPVYHHYISLQEAATSRGEQRVCPPGSPREETAAAATAAATADVAAVAAEVSHGK